MKYEHYHFITYHVGYESWPPSTSSLNGLEDVHHTFYLQTLQLRVDADECPSAGDSITSDNTFIGCDCNDYYICYLHMTTVCLEDDLI